VELRIIEEEKRLLAMSPKEEIAELAAHYEAKGLSPALARHVA
jgi:VIT1/CCC1 family predicted Fe2+/Mn2+ transporter